VVTTIPAVFIIDRVGRRPLLFAASAGMLATMVVTGGVAAKYEDSWAAHPAAGWACVVMIWLYIVNFAYGCEYYPVSTQSQDLY
jgi:hypothetical protein